MSSKAFQIDDKLASIILKIYNKHIYRKDINPLAEYNFIRAFALFNLGKKIKNNETFNKDEATVLLSIITNNLITNKNNPFIELDIDIDEMTKLYTFAEYLTKFLNID